MNNGQQQQQGGQGHAQQGSFGASGGGFGALGHQLAGMQSGFTGNNGNNGAAAGTGFMSGFGGSSGLTPGNTNGGGGGGHHGHPGAPHGLGGPGMMQSGGQGMIAPNGGQAQQQHGGAQQGLLQALNGNSPPGPPGMRAGGGMMGQQEVAGPYWEQQIIRAQVSIHVDEVYTALTVIAGMSTSIHAPSSRQGIRHRLPRRPPGSNLAPTGIQSARNPRSEPTADADRQYARVDASKGSRDG